LACLALAAVSACEELPDEPAYQDDAGHESVLANEQPAPDARVGQSDAGTATDAGSTADAAAMEGGSSDEDAQVMIDAGPQTDAGDVGDASSVGDASDVGDAGDAASAPGSFAAVYPIIAVSCGVSSCHMAGKLPDLSTMEIAYTQLVGMPAQRGSCGSDAGMPRIRVVAGDPAASLLMDKLEHTMPSCGSVMPRAGMLPQESVEIFRAWIAAGAPAQ
jgi:hypothetical protein